MPGGDRRGCSAPLKTDTQDVVQAWGTPGRWTAPRGRPESHRTCEAGRAPRGRWRSVHGLPAAGKGPWDSSLPGHWPEGDGEGAEGDPPRQQKGRTGGAGGQPAARGGRVAGGCWAEASATLQPGPRASRPLPGSLARYAARLDQHQLTADPHLPRPRPDGGRGAHSTLTAVTLLRAPHTMPLTAEPGGVGGAGGLREAAGSRTPLSRCRTSRHSGPAPRRHLGAAAVWFGWRTRTWRRGQGPVRDGKRVKERGRKLPAGRRAGRSEATVSV